MFEIKFTVDATPELIGALRDIAGAIHSVSRPMPALQGTQKNSPAERREGTEEDGTAEKAQNLTAETPVEAERPEAQKNVEEPKKRKQRAKKAPSESDTPVAPAVGDNSSPDGEAVPERATPEETSAPETAQEIAREPTHAEEAPEAPAEDPLAGKGQTGEILAGLTRKAVGDLDALGVDRGDANRRIRAYCDCHEIKFATFPALLHAVGYADAIEICKGNLK